MLVSNMKPYKYIDHTGKENSQSSPETWRLPGKINPRRNTSRHIVIKLTKIKNKNKILKTI